MSTRTVPTILDFIGTLSTDPALCLCKIAQEARISPFDDLPGDERYECSGQFYGHLAYRVISFIYAKSLSLDRD